MNAYASNVISLANKLVSANIAAPETGPVNLTDPTVTAAVTQLQELWTTTDSMVRGARAALYNFLGATYEFSRQFESNTKILSELRYAARSMYVSDSQKDAVAKKDASELLLVISMGVSQASLRSKYKRIFANAAAAGVAESRESFISWLESTGGIVNALCAAVAAIGPRETGKSGMPVSTRSMEDLLISNRGQNDHCSVTLDQNERGFTVVLFYTDSHTQEVFKIHESVDSALLRGAVKEAYEAMAKGTPDAATNRQAA